MRPFAADRVELGTFVGRSALVNDLVGRVARGSSWYLSAGRRTGKTMLLRKLESQIAQAGGTALYLDGQSLGAHASGSSVLGELVTATAGSADASVAGDTIRDLEGVIASTGAAWCLLVDEVETVAAIRDGRGLLDNLRYLASNSSVAEVASVGLAGGLDVLAHLRSSGSALSNICAPATLKPLESDDIIALVRLSSAGDRSELVAEYVIQLAGGHPYIAQLLLEYAPEPLADDLEAAFAPFTSEAVDRVSRILDRIDPVLMSAAMSVLRGEAAEPRAVAGLVAAGILNENSGSPRINGQIVASALTELQRRQGASSKADDATVEWLEGLIFAGETPAVEFKSSVRWDTRLAKANDTLALEVVQAIAGFMNSAGGTLIVGVGPSGEVLARIHR